MLVLESRQNRNGVPLQGVRNSFQLIHCRVVVPLTSDRQRPSDIWVSTPTLLSVCVSMSPRLHVFRSFGALRELRNVRHHVLTALFQPLVTTLVFN
jgi:hypothetical protein